MPQELRITMEDRPGSLAKLTEALARGSVNIEAIAAIPAGGSGDIRIVVDDPAKVRNALSGTGISVAGTRDILTVDLENRPGALAKIARKLADANVNIDAIYVIGASGGKKQLGIGVPDVAKAKQLIG